MASIAIKSKTTFICLSIFILFTLTTTTMAHNITKILSSEPDLSEFNSYLSQTKLSDEINSRQTITVLALDNSAMSTLTSNQSSLSAIKNILSLHVLLDYYDPKKLHSIQNGTVATTTLYQTTGSAAQGEGLVNITDLRGGSVGFGSGVPDSKLGSTYTKSIKQIPYNISVLQINKPIIVPSMLTSSSSDTNLTAVLDKGGCKTFASMLSQSGVLKMYQTQMENGITIFAPNDEAFKAKGIPDFTKLSSAELVSLLQFHALSSYSPIGTLKSSKGSLKTLAGDGKYYLSPSTAGDSITLHTNVDSSRIASTLLDSTPTVIYSVDNVLLPVALFGMAPSPSPTPIESPESSPSPSPAPTSPSPSPSGIPESSPPAPMVETPEGSPSESPADSPGAGADESSNNGGEGTSVPALSVALVALSGVICLML